MHEPKQTFLVASTPADLASIAKFQETLDAASIVVAAAKPTDISHIRETPAGASYETRFICDLERDDMPPMEIIACVTRQPRPIVRLKIKDLRASTTTMISEPLHTNDANAFPANCSIVETLEQIARWRDQASRTATLIRQVDSKTTIDLSNQESELELIIKAMVYSHRDQTTAALAPIIQYIHPSPYGLPRVTAMMMNPMGECAAQILAPEPAFVIASRFENLIKLRLNQTRRVKAFILDEYASPANGDRSRTTVLEAMKALAPFAHIESDLLSYNSFIPSQPIP